MKSNLFTLVLALTITFPTLSAQVPDLKETFVEAESYFLFEEYNEALPLYLKIHRADPENDNINYKIGICFLNDPYQKDKSIKYLEDASDNINLKYKENNYKERSAPLEVYFYLGNAHLVNNNIDEAIKFYQKFRNLLDEKIYDVELVEEQIRICNRAKDLMQKPVDFDKVNMSEIFNSRFPEINPILSGDGKRMVYVSKRQFYDATFFSEKINGEWQPPRNIIPELGVDGDVYPTCLSYDGNLMIIYRNDEFIGNLYTSEYVDGRWTPMVKIGGEINTKYWESHGSLSKDGNVLYFTSNRKDGYGGLDIYYALKQNDGSWGTPVNMGSTINTRYNEETPFITSDGNTLYFSSYGHYNMGGYDIFYSRKDRNGNWGTPVNLGYPINTTDDDVFFHPVEDGNHAYFSMFSNDGYGRHDIYNITVYSENNPRMYIISGTLGSDKGNIKNQDNVVVYLVDRVTGDTIAIGNPDLAQQEFDLKAPKGDYDLVIKSETFSELSTNVEIDDFTDKTTGITIQNKINLKTKPYKPLILTGEESRIEVEDTVFVARPGKKLRIRLKVPEDSELTANLYHDNEAVSSEVYNIEKNRFVYEFVPQEGMNVIDFSLKEANGDISQKRLIIKADKDPDAEISKEDRDEVNIPVEQTDAQEESPVEQPVESSETTVLNRVVNNLYNHSDGNLKQTLNVLSPLDEDINSSVELLEYLENESTNKGYSRDDIDRAAAKAISGGDAEILKDILSKNSNKEIADYLSGLDLSQNGIGNSEELIKHLRSVETDQEFSHSDITTALANSLEEVCNEAELLKLRLLKVADDDLRNILESSDLKALNITTEEQLLKYLEQNGIAKEKLDYYQALASTSNSAEKLRSELIQRSDGELNSLLRELDLKQNNIDTGEKLIDYLRSISGEDTFTEEELNRILELVNTEDSELDKTRAELLSYADGDLYDYLSELDTDRSDIYTPAELINHLADQAGEEYAPELLISVLSKLLKDQTLESFIDYLIENGPDSVKSFLKGLDLEEENITSITELVSYMVNHASDFGLSTEELQQLVINMMADFSISSILEAESQIRSKGLPLPLQIGGGLLFAGILIFIILFLRKKKKKDE